jgi:hypothetical protein
LRPPYGEIGPLLRTVLIRPAQGTVHVAEVTGVAHAKAARGYQQRGVDQQGPTSNTINICVFYCFLKLFTGLFAVFFADRSVSFAPTVVQELQDRFCDTVGQAFEPSCTLEDFLEQHGAVLPEATKAQR